MTYQKPCYLFFTEDEQKNIKLEMSEQLSWEFLTKCYAITTQLTVIMADKIEPKAREGELIPQRDEK